MTPVWCNIINQTVEITPYCYHEITPYCHHALPCRHWWARWASQWGVLRLGHERHFRHVTTRVTAVTVTTAPASLTSAVTANTRLDTLKVRTWYMLLCVHFHVTACACCCLDPAHWLCVLAWWTQKGYPTKLPLWCFVLFISRFLLKLLCKHVHIWN